MSQSDCYQRDQSECALLPTACLVLNSLRFLINNEDIQRLLLTLTSFDTLKDYYLTRKSEVVGFFILWFFNG